MWIHRSLIAGLALVLVAPALADETHPFSVHDLLAMDRVSDPRTSPDGKRVAFVVRETDLDADRGRTDLWLADVDGREARRLTTHQAADWSPRWSPDGGALYFLSRRSGSAQVWKLSLAGGEAQPVSELPLDAANLLVSPDGKTLVFTLDVFPDCRGLDCTVKRLEEEEQRKSSGILFERLFIRHWDTWKDGRRSHLFAMPSAGGEAVELTPGLDADVPSKPFGGPEEIAFLPNGKGLVFTARDAGREEAWSVDFDLYLTPLDASSPPVTLTDDNPAWDTHPVFSPDGSTLAWLAMERPGFEADRRRIRLRDWSTGEVRTLTESWDRSPGSILWSADGRTLFATASNLGQRSLFAVDVAAGSVRTVVRDGTIGGLARAAGGRVLFGKDSLLGPVELFTVAPDGSDLRPVTNLNAEKLAAARLGEPEPFTFAGWNDETVHGYVVKPADFDSEKRYPVAFLIHGGPQGSFGNRFHYRWNPQAYAGAGYAAVMVDFHGSTGYGQAFTDAIREDWGGKPLVDLQKGLAAALERNPWMDGERVAALGASYGGYMVNWIAGNWPDRFRCLVSHDGNLDERAAYYQTEELWFPEWEHGGTPWDNPAGYEKQNPVNFVQNWKTPMLVVHGAKDYRVVDTAGIATFTALQRLGIPSQLLYFPDENHWVLRPHNSILWHETVLAWLDRWTK